MTKMFRHEREAEEVSAEIRGHLEERIEELVTGGMERRDAEAAARREFGNLMRTKEDGRAAWGWAAVQDFFQDLRYGLRQLRRSPGFMVVAVLTLALGIGANTAIFSYVDAWMIKPLPYPQPERLMVLQAHDVKQGWTSDWFGPAAEVADLQRESHAFDEVVAWDTANFNLTGDGPPAFVEGGRVSWNFFETLGAKPLLGRTFSEEDDRPGAARVAVLSQGLWKSRYASDPEIVGKSVRINDEPATVIGVMPANFQFPLLGIANVWMPRALSEKESADRNAPWTPAIARLKPGVTQKQATDDTAAIFARLEKSYPETNRNRTVIVSTLTSEVGRHEGTSQVMACFWIVGLILMMACANVANLMLARATSRAKEFALRRALGAGRGRLARQLLSESMLLFFFGGVAGTLFGIWGTTWIQSAIPDRIRGYLVNFGQVSMNVNVLGFTLGIALLCGLIFGLAPAFESSRVDLNRPLKESSGTVSNSRRGGRLRRIFVAAEIALAVVVLIATTLLVRSFVNSVKASPGFTAAGATVAQMELPKTKYAKPETLRNFADEVLARARALPEVRIAGAASGTPYGAFGQVMDVAASGKPKPQPGEKIGARFTAASIGYFETMQIPLMKGRTFTSEDAPGMQPSAIVNEHLAKQLWPNEDPIGKKLEFGPEHTVCTVVGVVANVKMYYLRAKPERQMYVALAQFPSQTLGIVARTAENAPALNTSMRDAIWSVDGDQPVSSIERLDTLMAISNSGDRILTKLVSFFGLLSMLLGAIGIYGLASQQVSQRTQEIGIRLALGASRGGVMKLVIAQGMKLALIGVAIGVVAAYGVTKSLATLLYGVKPGDVLTYVSVAALFLLVAIAAGYLPARRAMKIDPIVALRCE